MSQDRLPLRLPTVQARPANTYYAPNTKRPEPIAPITPPAPQDTQMETALGNLARGLITFGSTLKKDEINDVVEAEQLKVQRMNVEEARAYSKQLAKEAEEAGVIDFGTNFYRIEAAQRSLARKMMREVYSPMLTEAETRMTDPMSPDSSQEYAKQSFQAALEHENILGFYGQAEARAIYEQVADPWIEGVRKARGQRMVKYNEELVADTAVSVVGKFLDGDIDWAEAQEEFTRATDDLYDVGGGSGKAQLAAGLKAAVTTRANRAIADGDSDALGDLEDLMVLIRAKDDEKAYTGPLDFGVDQSLEIEEIDTLLTQARYKIENQPDNDRIEHERTVSDFMAAYMLDNRDNLSLDHNSLDHQNMLRAIDTAVAAGTLNRDAANIYLLRSFERDYNSLTQAGESPKGLLDSMMMLVHSYTDYEATEASIMASDLVGNDKLAMLNLLSGERVERLRNETVVETIHADAVAEVELVSADVENLVTAAVGDNIAVNEVVVQLPHTIREHAKSLIVTTRNNTSGDDEAKRIAADGALKTFRDSIREVTIREEGEVDFDIDRARELGLPDSIIRDMIAVSQSVREGQLAARRIGTDYHAGITIDEADWGTKNPFGWIDNISALDATPLNAADRAYHNDEIADLRKWSKVPFTRGIYDSWIARHYKRKFEEGGFVYEGLTLSQTRAGVKPSVVDVDATAYYEQAARLVGMTPDMMLGDQKNRWGWDMSERGVYKDPYQTLMNNPDTWLRDLEEIANTNTATMEEEDLIKKLSPTNDIVRHYTAYKSWVGENDAVSFDVFITLQYTGIGHYTLPRASDTLMDKLIGN